MPAPNIQFRVLTPADIPFGMMLKQEAGWNQLEADWRRCLALEPEGCFLASLGDRPVGTVTTCRFGTLGWIGMLLVAKASRGQGVGTALLRESVAWLERQGMATIRLDASEMGKAIYEKHGFVTRYRVFRYQGRARLSESSAACEPIPMQDVLRLDREVLTVPRDAFLHALCVDGGAQGVRDSGLWSGYGLSRAGANARQIGPVVAHDAVAGEALVAAQCRLAGDTTLFVDVPEPNAQARSYVEALGLFHARTFWRMDLGPAPAEKLECYWACTGPEKG